MPEQNQTTPTPEEREKRLLALKRGAINDATREVLSRPDVRKAIIELARTKLTRFNVQFIDEDLVK